MTSFREAQAEAQAEFQAHEMNPDRGERAWLRWVDQVEREIAPVSIDGDRTAARVKAGTADPCAIDELVEWFDAGWSVRRAVAAVTGREAAQ